MRKKEGSSEGMVREVEECRGKYMVAVPRLGDKIEKCCEKRGDKR